MTEQEGAFGRYTRAVARTGIVLLGAGLAGLVAYLVAVGHYILSGAAGGEAVHVDFTALWAAAKLALSGEPAAAYDFTRLEAEQQISGEWAPYYWLYPPVMQMLLTPFGALGFVPAFAVWTLLSAGLYGLAAFRIAPAGSGAGAWALAAPPCAMALMSGSFGLLWVAGFAWALTMLDRNRAWPAALTIALMAVKPQLGLLVPVALIAGGYWRVFALTTLSLAGLIAVTLALWGAAPWVAFADQLLSSGQGYSDGRTNAGIMITWFAFGRWLGLGDGPALMLQCAATLSAAAVVARVWSRPATFAIKAAVLTFATLVATPYGYLYEFAILLVGGLFLLNHGVGRTVGGRLWLAAIWGFALPFYAGVPIAAYAAPGIAIFLALAVREVLPATARERSA